MHSQRGLGGIGIIRAIETVFSERSYVLVFFIFSVAFACLYLFLPLATVPGSSLSQFSSSWLKVVLVALISLAMGLLASMQVFAWRKTGHKLVKESAGGLAAAVTSVISGLFASASCGVCLTALFSFVGAGGAVFLMGHQLSILLVSLALILVSMYFTARKINDECPECVANLVKISSQSKPAIKMKQGRKRKSG
jgi:hypothetical protein